MAVPVTPAVMLYLQALVGHAGNMQNDTHDSTQGLITVFGIKLAPGTMVVVQTKVRASWGGCLAKVKEQTITKIIQW